MTEYAKRQYMGWRRPLHGFTLVELLVVMAIISILAALLLPVLHRVMERARTIKCANNQKQIYVGFLPYTDEHAGWIPWDYYWTNSTIVNKLGYKWWDICGLWPYVYPGRTYIRSDIAGNRTVFTCPEKTPDHPTHGDGQLYTVNNALPEAGWPNDPARFSEITKHSKAMLYFECADNNGAYWMSMTGWGKYIIRHHSDGTNFLFADGHQRWLPGDQVPVGAGDDKSFWTGR